jgi:hypothetical protein
MLSISWLPLQKETADPETILSTPATNNHTNEETASLYYTLDLQQRGLSMQAFEYAYKGYRRLLQEKIISKQDYLTICDFSQSSNNKRFYLVDMVNNKVILNTYVAHGRNSGGEYATRFSNRSKSLQSSLGFYVTQSVYYGEHGLSLRVAGLEKGYNDKALQRNIVIHGADYIGDKKPGRYNYMGRSYGCPAIPRKECNQVINMIKNGSCVFIYHPSKNYLHGSKILNG